MNRFHTRLFIPIFIVVFTFTACQLPALTPPAPTAIPDPTATPRPIPIPTERLSDEEATELMHQVGRYNRAAAQEAYTRIRESGDTRFVAVFLELMRINQIMYGRGALRGLGYAENIGAMEQLSGQRFGDDWAAWVEWYGGTDLTPPPGFTGWKGELLAEVDEQFADFLRDSHPSRIRTEEIMWGGVVVDGIPALDNATMLTPEAATYLIPEEPVFGLVINGDARAYPLRILDWHEMANDVVGGVPVSIAYCTLCGAAIAYDGRASDGNTYTFGSSGFLYRSNKLMYDRQTRTLWNQISGEPVLGELVDTDVKLPILPIVLSSWGEWLQQHPETKVLDIETGFSRPYEVASAYGHYFSDTETMFPVWQRSERFETKDRIFALNLNDIPKAYPVEALTTERVVNDAVGETNVVLTALRDRVTVTGESRRAGRVTYDAGGEVRAYERGEYQFTEGTDPDTLVDAAGNTWRITEDALVGSDGATLPRLGGHLAYWFGWFAFYPATEVYQGG